MGTRATLSICLLLAPSLVQAQGRLARIISPVVAATVTIPAMSFRGDLAGVNVNLGITGANIGLGGWYLDLAGPTGVSQGSTAMLTNDGVLPNGNYAVRFDFVNVGFASQLAITGPAGPLPACSLNAVPGYNNVQSCTANFSITNGHLSLSIQPTSGVQMTLKQVTVTRFQ